jgi:hypothetical protein
LKVRAGEQWDAQRALYRAVKDALDKRDVDIPALNRMVVDSADANRYGQRRVSDEARPKNPGAKGPTP